MSATRERSLAAAASLVGTQGTRALTHARVDAEAGLPRGSTSNHFRTRASLLTGLATWIAEQETRDLGALLAEPFDDVDGFVDLFSSAIELLTGPYAVRTRARYALFLELADDPELGEPLRRQRREFERWTERIMTTVGIADPGPAARALMALGDGLLLHRLTVDPALDMRPAIERAVRALAQT